jgi:hypothetical protein
MLTWCRTILRNPTQHRARFDYDCNAFPARLELERVDRALGGAYRRSVNRDYLVMVNFDSLAMGCVEICGRIRCMAVFQAE